MHGVWAPGQFGLLLAYLHVVDIKRERDKRRYVILGKQWGQREGGREGGREKGGREGGKEGGREDRRRLGRKGGRVSDK